MLRTSLGDKTESLSCSFSRSMSAIISPSTFQRLISDQTLWFSLRYASSTSYNAHSFTLSYLIQTCGLSPTQDASASKHVSFETPDKPDLVINFLKSHGFSKSEILLFINWVPSCLRYDTHKTFLPKIEFFKSKGVSSSEIPRLIYSFPTIMTRSLNNHLIPSFDLLLGIVHSDEKLIEAIIDCSSILADPNSFTLPNLELLREARVPESNVIRLFPRALAKSLNRFKDIVEEVKEIGIGPWKVQFIMAVHVCSSLKKSTRDQKVDLYKKWGWPDNDILAAFRKYPFLLTVPDDNIDAVMDFLVNKLSCDSSTFSKYPTVFFTEFGKANCSTQCGHSNYVLKWSGDKEDIAWNI